MTKKELIKLLDGISDNTEIRFFHDGMLLPFSTIKEMNDNSGWKNTIALTGVVSDRYQSRFKN